MMKDQFSIGLLFLYKDLIVCNLGFFFLVHGFIGISCNDQRILGVKGHVPNGVDELYDAQGFGHTHSQNISRVIFIKQRTTGIMNDAC